MRVLRVITSNPLVLVSITIMYLQNYCICLKRRWLDSKKSRSFSSGFPGESAG